MPKSNVWRKRIYHERKHVIEIIWKLHGFISKKFYAGVMEIEEKKLANAGLMVKSSSCSDTSFTKGGKS